MVEIKVVPNGRCQRNQFQSLVISGPKTNEAGDKQVAVSEVKIVLRMSCRAANRTVDSRPERSIDKLGEQVTEVG